MENGITKSMPEQIYVNPIYKVLEVDHSDYEDMTIYDSNYLDNAKEEALKHAKNGWDKGEGGLKYVCVTEIFIDDDGVETYSIIYEREYDQGPEAYPEDYEDE